MQLVIKDQNGNEVSFERVSLTPGGIEIVLGDFDSVAAPVSVAPAEIPAPAYTSDAPSEATYTPDVPAEAPSVFGSEPVTQVVTPTAELDKDGVPWDERIHSSSKKQTTKGVWAKRKNLPEGLYEQVTAELKSGNPQPEPAPISTERPAPVTPPAAPVAESQPAPPSVPDLPNNVEPAPAVPTQVAAPTPPPIPDPGAPLPEGNQVGDPNDLSSILSSWPSNG